MNMPIDNDTEMLPRRTPAKKAKAKNKAGRPAKDAKERNASAAEAQTRLEAMRQPVRRNSPRTDLDPPARQTREMARSPSRQGAATVEGRDGEMLTRMRVNTGGDPFELPEKEIPTGWSYQWNPVTVLNEEMTAIQVRNHANGWRPVPADRHPGRWFKPEYKGAIIVEGLRLEERPMALTKEAQVEDNLAARKLMRDQTDALKLTTKLPEGFSDARKYRGTGLNGRVAMAIDANLTLPEAGGYEVEE
jgi:hypothetical protein